MEVCAQEHDKTHPATVPCPPSCPNPPHSPHLQSMCYCLVHCLLEGHAVEGGPTPSRHLHATRHDSGVGVRSGVCSRTILWWDQLLRQFAGGCWAHALRVRAARLLAHANTPARRCQAAEVHSRMLRCPQRLSCVWLQHTPAVCKREFHNNSNSNSREMAQHRVCQQQQRAAAPANCMCCAACTGLSDRIRCRFKVQTARWQAHSCDLCSL